jgi:hypothetical protein
MDQSWQCAELATTVTGFEQVRLLCAGLHDRYGEYMQVEHDIRTASANSQCYKLRKINVYLPSLVMKVPDHELGNACRHHSVQNLLSSRLLSKKLKDQDI